MDREVLDAGIIESLKTLGGDDEPELFAELVELFLQDTPSRMQELNVALDQGDTTRLERAAHALKSSAANLGALGLSSLFKEIEDAGRKSDLERAAPLVGHSAREFGRVEAALRSQIA